MTRHAIILAVSLCLSRALPAQILSELSQPPNGNNQRAEVTQWVGPVKISIDYHSPHVHSLAGVDRKGHIWGGLVAYGFFDEGFGPSHATPWRAGANESTTISLSHDVLIEGKPLKAGTYALFLAIAEQGPWTWIFSNKSDGWGSFQYDQKNDALRVAVDPQEAPYTEDLTYGFDERRPGSATGYLQWENKRISFHVGVPNVNELYVDAMRKELQSWPGFNYRNWQFAAQFCADNKVNLEEALVWADKAIYEPFRNAAQGRQDFSTMSTKAAVLDAMGRSSDADTTMDRALTMPGADLQPVHAYGNRLLQAGRKERALAIFTLNQRRHPEEKFVTHVGLARGFAAVGDTAKAIKQWETALANIPENQKVNRPAYERSLEALRKSR